MCVHKTIQIIHVSRRIYIYIYIYINHINVELAINLLCNIRESMNEHYDFRMG